MTDMHATYGGPHVSRTRGTDVHKLARDLIKRTHGATHRDRGEEFMRLIEDEYPELAVDVYTYFITNAANAYAYHVKNGHEGAQAAQEAAEKATAAKVAVQERAKKYLKAAVFNILNSTLGGKDWREAKFSDAKRAGGFWSEIAKKGKPNQIIGKVLTDKEFLQIWRKSK